jgi:hypothetical protein
MIEWLLFAGDFWNDIKLALALLFFIYAVVWLTELTRSPKLGILIAAIVAYLTFFKYWEIVIFVLIFFFGYPFFEQFAYGYAPKVKVPPGR